MLARVSPSTLYGETVLALNGKEYSLDEGMTVIADEAAFDEMIRLSGQDLAPVLEVDGKILADFGPDQLAEFMSQLEKKNAKV